MEQQTLLHVNKHKKKITQTTKRPRRVCTDNTNAGGYCDFFNSDSDGSDPEENSSGSDENEAYNPATEGVPIYDEKRGKDNWLGRRIVKTFGDHGDFEGIIYVIDEDKNKQGYRLFCVHYFEDPDDGESMWPIEVFQ